MNIYGVSDYGDFFTTSYDNGIIYDRKQGFAFVINLKNMKSILDTFQGTSKVETDGEQNGEGYTTYYFYDYKKIKLC